MASPITVRRWIFIISLVCLIIFLLRRSQDASQELRSVGSGEVTLHRRNIGGPCNLDEGGNDPKAVVEIYRMCRDELKRILENDQPIPAVFQESSEGRAMVERTRRLVNAKAKCKTRKVATIPMIDSWIRVSRPHELAYCQLEKTGSSTMLTFLCEINNMETMYPRNDDLHHTSLDHFKVVGEESVELANRYLDVVQVRHPFTRLVSCYCEKVLNERPPFVRLFDNFKSHRGQSAAELVKNHLPHYRFIGDATKGTKSEQFQFQFFLKVLQAPGKEEFLARKYTPEGPDPDNVPSFREFAMEVAYQIMKCGINPECRKQINPSFGRQVDKCDPCAWDFDLLIKLETIDDDFPLLRKLIGVYKEEPAPEEQEKSGEAEAAPVVNRKISACKSYEHYMHQLESDDLDLLYTAYFEDFELFDYKPFEV